MKRQRAQFNQQEVQIQMDMQSADIFNSHRINVKIEIKITAFKH